MTARAGGAGTITLEPAWLTLADGRAYEPWVAGVPLRVEDGAQAETVTVTTSTCAIGGPSSCELSASFAYAHNGRLEISSGSGGLQEAIDYLAGSGGGTVILTPDWAAPASALAQAQGSSRVQILDERAGAQTWYAWSGTGYAPTATVNGQTAGVTAANVEGVRYADQYPGADIGAQVNAAIAAVGCGRVVIPAGHYSFSTTIVKPRCVQLDGQGEAATVLNFVPTTGVAIAVGDNAGSIGSDDGLSGITLLGAGPVSAAIGLWLGGDPAGKVLPPSDFGNSQHFRQLKIAGFQAAIEWGSNSYLETFEDCILGWAGAAEAGSNNAVAITEAAGAVNDAEKNLFLGGQIMNETTHAVAGVNEDLDLHFVGTSIDFANGAGIGSDGANATFFNASFTCDDCHIEQNSGPVVLDTTQNYLNLFSGIILYDDSSGITTPAIITMQGNQPGLTIQNVGFNSNHAVGEAINFAPSGGDAALIVLGGVGNGNGLIASLFQPGFTYEASYLIAPQSTTTSFAHSFAGSQFRFHAGVEADTVPAGWGLHLFDANGGDAAPNKYIGVAGATGNLFINNSAYSGNILTLGDNGLLTLFNAGGWTSLQANSGGSGQVVTLPAAAGTLALTAGPQTFSGAQTFTGPVAVSGSGATLSAASGATVNFSAAGAVALPGTVTVASDANPLIIPSPPPGGATLAVTSQLPLTGSTGSLGGTALPAGNCAVATATVPNATPGMAVAVSPAADPGTGFVWEGWASAAGSVTVRLCNITAGTLTPTAEVYNVRVLP